MNTNVNIEDAASPEEIMATKKCSVCGEVKALEAFMKDRTHRDGLTYSCKVCGAARARAYYADNPEKLTAYYRAYKAANPEKLNMNTRRLPKVPVDFPVQPLKPGQIATAIDPCTCGTCGRTWDDGISTSSTPAPAGRCPFEYFHKERTTI